MLFKTALHLGAKAQYIIHTAIVLALQLYCNRKIGLGTGPSKLRSRVIT